MSVNVKMM